MKKKLICRISWMSLDCESPMSNDTFWSILDTFILMRREEVMAYHLYRIQVEKKEKKEKGLKMDMQYLAAYEKRQKEEKSICFPK